MQEGLRDVVYQLALSYVLFPVQQPDIRETTD